MLKKFIDFIFQESLFENDDKILLTVSGGPDSVILCELFYRAKYNFGIAHCNFHLRGKESDEDEIFVRDLSKKYKVQFYVKHFNTKKYAKDNHISIEMAARDLRYNWFFELLKKEKYKYIATGHHLDDQIETFFINIIRGTGIAGLHGIISKQNNIIRPLLFAYRNDIEAFLKKNNIPFRTDSTNNSVKFMRNKFRNLILPQLYQINKNYKKTIINDIERLKDAEFIYKTKINEVKKNILIKGGKNILIPIEKLKELNPLRTYLFEFLSSYNFNFSTVEDIISRLDDISGKQFFSSSHRLIKDREYLIISELDKKSEANAIEFFINENDLFINTPVSLKFKKLIYNKDFIISKDKFIACFDKDKLKFPLQIRKWEKGDYFYPFGMNKKKKLSDFFIDEKFSLLEKEKIWLLCSDNDIVWIIGKRIDNRFRIRNNTKNIFQAVLVE
ncbi:MAG: tRNA lysidine(34) synthetase TilS [Bacteroidales bacterium]|nr:tRNA lysidine(34) synthetase TilS [Bacteroidales bacterium]